MRKVVSVIFIPLLFVIVLGGCGSQSQFVASQNFMEVRDNVVLTEADTVPDVWPQYPNGWNGFMEDVMRNLTYPEQLRRRGIEGLVLVTFTISEQGRIEEFEVLRSPHRALEESAIRAIRQTKSWQPALKDDEPVRMRYRAPISFMMNR